MRTTITAMSIALVAGILLPAASQAEAWKIESEHSQAGFSIRHMMVSKVNGQFNRVAGSVDYDGKDISKAKVNAEIDIAKVDTGESDRDKHLLTPDFFDLAKYPKMTFVSEKIQRQGDGKFTMTGKLTLHGVTKEVTLNCEGPTPQVKDPYGNICIGASASTKINRKDFGLTYNKVMDNGGAILADEVPVTIDLELVKKADQASLPNTTR